MASMKNSTVATCDRDAGSLRDRTDAVLPTIIDTFDLDREHVDRVIAKIEDLIREGRLRRVVVTNASGAVIQIEPGD